MSYADPYVPEITTRRHPGLTGRRAVPLEPATVGAADAVLIVTDHDDVDCKVLVAAARLVVDTRNATRHLARHRERIVLA